MQRRLRTMRRANLADSLSYFSTKFLYVIAYAIGLGLGAFLYQRGQITLGTAYLITFYIGMLAAPLDRIQRQVRDMQAATAGIARIDTLLLAQPAMLRTGTELLPSGALSVQLERVTFSYEDGDSVLHDLCLSLQPGETLGLLGSTGSGKTTVTRLLARLYDPDAGSIRLDGFDLREVSEDSLRQRVGVVTQDVQFFRATVRDNLTFFAAKNRDAEILDVLQQLDLWNWYCALPHGLDTMLGAGGAGLSAGQAQLLAFARVFLRDSLDPASRPGLVILDEATSRLDPATERAVEHAVDRLLAGRTGVIVAHRLRTVSRVDRIAILERGRVVETGRRADLLRDPASRFSSLMRVGLEEVLV
jgi:ATP-binding cassette subfamily B protein